MKARITSIPGGLAVVLDNGKSREIVRNDERQAQKEAGDLLAALAFLNEEELAKLYPELAA